MWFLLEQFATGFLTNVVATIKFLIAEFDLVLQALLRPSIRARLFMPSCVLRLASCVLRLASCVLRLAVSKYVRWDINGAEVSATFDT